MITVEPCPPQLRHLDQPQYGGSVFFRLPETEADYGRAGCPCCGWSGVPTFVSGVALTICPCCGHDPDPRCDEQLVKAASRIHPDVLTRLVWSARLRAVRTIVRVPRNQPCPCGSGVKAKRCDCTEYTV